MDRNMLGRFVGFVPSSVGGGLISRSQKLADVASSSSCRRVRYNVSAHAVSGGKKNGVEGDNGWGAADDKEEETLESARKALTDQFQREKDQIQNFDGYALQKLLKEKWGKSYDIQLKGTPWLNGQTLLTVNIMWKYAEQQSFPLSTEDYLCHLEAITQYLKKWNAVQHFVTYVKATKEKPRVSKAVAVPIELPPEIILDPEFQ